MVRFTGNNLHPTDFPRASAWVERLVQWFDAGLESVVFLFHQPEEEHCGEISVHFLDELQKRMPLGIKPPILYHKQQQELF